MNHELITILREAGKIERCHTIPHHGTYTTGQHCHDMLSLLFALHPEPSMDLVRAIQTHDVGERWIGDIPGPAKYTNHKMSETADEAEFDCRYSIGVISTLTRQESEWLKALDKIELWLWAKDQVALGNKNVDEVLTLVEGYILGCDWIPEPCMVFVRDYKWERTTDVPPRK